MTSLLLDCWPPSLALVPRYLPSHFSLFTPLFSLSLSIDLFLSFLIFSQIEEVARRLLNIFLLNSKSFHLATTLAVKEIESTETPSILFRGNSLATKVVDLFMKEYGEHHLRTILRGCIEAIYNDKGSCEVDPTKIEKIGDLQANRERLVAHVQACWKTIRDAVTEVPE